MVASKSPLQPSVLSGTPMTHLQHMNTGAKSYSTHYPGYSSYKVIILSTPYPARKNDSLKNLLKA